jgi:hypothetical protein
MRVKRNIIARSPNRCCNGNVTMCSLHIAELRVTLNYIKLFGATFELFCSELCRLH